MENALILSTVPSDDNDDVNETFQHINYLYLNDYQYNQKLNHQSLIQILHLQNFKNSNGEVVCDFGFSTISGYCTL